MSGYKPYRILQPIHVVIDDGDDMRECYPHGVFNRQRRITPGRVAVLYNPGVIDAPTEEEMALFDLPMLADFVKQIPQDPRGFDVRDSGLARSIETSLAGRERGIMESFERKSRSKSKKKETLELEQETDEIEKEDEIE